MDGVDGGATAARRRQRTGSSIIHIVVLVLAAQVPGPGLEQQTGGGFFTAVTGTHEGGVAVPVLGLEIGSGRDELANGAQTAVIGKR